MPDKIGSLSDQGRTDKVYESAVTRDSLQLLDMVNFIKV